MAKQTTPVATPVATPAVEVAAVVATPVAAAVVETVAAPAAPAAKAKREAPTPSQVVRSIIKNATIKGKMSVDELDLIVALATKMKTLAEALSEVK
jgi:hypothetical protein